MLILSLIVGAILSVGLVLSSLLLWLSAYLARAPKAGPMRALVATLTLTVVGILYLPATLWLRRELAPEGNSAPLLVAECVLGFLFLLAGWIVLMRAFEVSLPRALLIWVMNLIPALVLFPAIYVPLKIFVMEAYAVPTNGMAPMILGWHNEITCPRCAGTLILSAPEPNQPRMAIPGEERLGICGACRKTSPALGQSTLHGPDRILVSKLHSPERWDAIVFRYPPEPAQKYVKRLVGLPGEKVYLKENSVWINDAKLAMPADLQGLEYTAEMEGMPNLRGTEENPVLLGADEFFVLGDFSKSSSDSRFWGPVPGANIEGVVSLCYWPTSRWRVFR